MHRPDTIIEIHRERVEDQTVEMVGGDKYTDSVDGPGYSAAATLDLTLDGRRYLRVENEAADKVHRNPRCCGQDNEAD
jgi:hypothetical protein